MLHFNSFSDGFTIKKKRGNSGHAEKLQLPHWLSKAKNHTHTFFQYLIYFYKTGINKRHVPISVSDCTSLIQEACYWTHTTIAHKTLHKKSHTYCPKTHTYKTYTVIYIYNIKVGKLIGTQIKKKKKWGKGNITEAAKVRVHLNLEVNIKNKK